MFSARLLRINSNGALSSFLGLDITANGSRLGSLGNLQKKVVVNASRVY